MFFQYPYTDLYSLNLDWLIRSMREVQEKIEQDRGERVLSFNTRTGTVTLLAADVNALGINSVAVVPSISGMSADAIAAAYDSGVRILLEGSAGTYTKAGFMVAAEEGIDICMLSVDMAPIQNQIDAIQDKVNPETAAAGDVFTIDAQGNSVWAPPDATETDALKAKLNKVVPTIGAAHPLIPALSYFYYNNELRTANVDIAADAAITDSNSSIVTDAGLTDVLNNAMSAFSQLDDQINPEGGGTPGQFLQVDSNGTTIWGPPATEAAIGAAVTSWLDTNVPTGTTVVVDRSLTVDGAAADAKVTGDEIRNLKSAFNQIANAETTFFPLENWRNGYLRDSAPIGSVGNSTQNLVCGYNGTNCILKGDDKTYSIAIATGWKLRRIAKYSGNTVGYFIEFVDTSSGEVTLSKNYYYIFEILKEPITDISPSDVTDTTIVLSETKYTPLLSEEVHSYNWCNPSDITEHSGKYLDTEGTEGIGSQYSYTGFIPVSAGDKVYILRDGMIRTDARFRYVTAYNSSKVVQSSLGESTTGRIYTVPSGVAYIRVSVFLNDYNLGNYAININRIMPYDEYGEETLPTGVGENKNDILLLNEMPLSTMPEYIVKALAYRPLASLKKGYICLVTDDGKEGIVSYTIPMVINKQVPCTFAVMSESECFATAERTQTVVDAVNNHGCAISQHGGRNWTEYSEYGLNKFFEEETAFFTSIGLTAKSAVIPSHYTTPLVQTVAGGRYGVVRSGYKGYNADGVYGGTVHNYYDYYTSGEGSNLFGLSSYNFSGRSLADNQMAIDYAYANNKIMIVYWHENALTDATKAVMEQSIDYAKSKGLEFITLNQIPYLNEWSATF